MERGFRFFRLLFSPSYRSPPFTVIKDAFFKYLPLSSPSPKSGCVLFVSIYVFFRISLTLSEDSFPFNISWTVLPLGPVSQSSSSPFRDDSLIKSDQAGSFLLTPSLCSPSSPGKSFIFFLREPFFQSLILLFEFEGTLCFAPLTSPALPKNSRIPSQLSFPSSQDTLRSRQFCAPNECPRLLPLRQHLL